MMPGPDDLTNVPATLARLRPAPFVSYDAIIVVVNPMFRRDIPFLKLRRQTKVTRLLPLYPDLFVRNGAVPCQLP
jgi:hypothetical protein